MHCQKYSSIFVKSIICYAVICQKCGENDHHDQKEVKRTVFLSLSTTICQLWSRRIIKTIKHNTTKDCVSIFIKFNLRQTLICREMK